MTKPNHTRETLSSNISLINVHLSQKTGVGLKANKMSSSSAFYQSIVKNICVIFCHCCFDVNLCEEKFFLHANAKKR